MCTSHLAIVKYASLVWTLHTFPMLKTFRVASVLNPKSLELTRVSEVRMNLLGYFQISNNLVNTSADDRYTVRTSTTLLITFFWSHYTVSLHCYLIIKISLMTFLWLYPFTSGTPGRLQKPLLFVFKLRSSNFNWFQFFLLLDVYAFTYLSSYH